MQLKSPQLNIYKEVTIKNLDKKQFSNYF